MPGKRIAIVGTGANGAGIGADLTRAGLDVTLIEQWPENVEAMRANGIRVEMPDETTETDVTVLHLCEVATLHEKFDIVFLVVKAYDTRWACELIKPHVADDGLVVGLQNGMTVDDIADIMGADRALGSVIEIAAAMFTPGVVERHTPPSGTWFAIGSLSDATRGREHEVAEVLRHAGTVEVVDDIRSSKWMKLVVNAAELVTSAILNLPLLEAARVPGMHEFMLEAGTEAVRTAVAGGRKVVPIFGLSGVDPEDPDGFVVTMLDAVYTQWSLPHTLTTVLQDWVKGRHSEVDELNGFIVTEAARLGIPSPANARTVEIAARIESGELAADPSNAALLLAPL
ncbi:2-dehydropantoate 2-reductase [soil metagenome]